MATCSACAEAVEAGATVCRRCGARLAPAPAAPGPEVARRFATLALVGVCLFWGVSFVFIKDIDRVLARDLRGPEWLAALWVVAVRFLWAGLLLLCVPGVVGAMRRPVLKDALWLAIPSVLGYALQVAGMRGLDPGTNAFLTSLYTPLTPILAWLLLRRVPSGHLVAAVLVALLGVGLLAKATLDEAPPTAAGATPSTVHIGLVLAADVCWALQILGIDRWARRHPTGAFSCALFLWIGLGGLLALLGGAAIAGVSPAALVAPLPDPHLLGRMAGLVFLSTLGAMMLMNRFQPSVDPSRAALLYTLEPVFAATFAALVDGERFGGLKLVGCLVLLGANLVVEAPALSALLARRRAATSPSV